MFIELEGEPSGIVIAERFVTKRFTLIAMKPVFALRIKGVSRSLHDFLMLHYNLFPHCFKFFLHPSNAEIEIISQKIILALWVCFYNLCRVHESLRMTPAMALGVTDHIWSISELIASALDPTDAPPLPPVERPNTLRAGYAPFKPYVISGGRAAARPSPKKS